MDPRSSIKTFGVWFLSEGFVLVGIFVVKVSYYKMDNWGMLITVKDSRIGLVIFWSYNDVG